MSPDAHPHILDPSRPIVVLALGGNALLRRGDQPNQRTEKGNLSRAVGAVVEVARDHAVVVTHGNGPQVGLLADREAASDSPQPLDVLGAETEGMIGYLLEREIRSRLPNRPVVTLLSQVVVERSDEAFVRPTKPIGPVYTRTVAKRLALERGWSILPDGDGWRRVVPSPVPRRILELESVRVLLRAHHIVVCVGGGGIPVTVGKDGSFEGVEAVVDKDRSSALLASGLGADWLLLLTDEAAVYRDWPGRAAPLRQITIGELSRLSLAAGSMGPKVEAAAHFVRETDGRAAIGAVEDARAILEGVAGTQIVDDG
jgi:carbamate kinase